MPTGGPAAFQRLMLMDKRLVAPLMLDLSSYNGTCASREIARVFRSA